MKNFKKVLAFLCSATLIVGSSVTAFATEPTSGTTPSTTTGGNGYVVAYSCETVTVPTAVKVSFNPQGWEFITRTHGDEDPDTSTAQIVSLNYGISSMSTLDKKISVDFDIEGTAGDGTKDIVFVDSAAKAQAKTTENADGAAPGEYKMYLAVAPSKAAVAKGYDNSTEGAGAETDLTIETAEDTGVKTSTVTTALLGDVVMDAATGTGVQAFADNKASIAYKLGKATYELIPDTNPDFATTQSAFASMVMPSTLGDIVGFTFVGAMNPNVDWTKAKLTALKVTPTYEVEDVDGTETVLETPATNGYQVIGAAASSGSGSGSSTITMTPNANGVYVATISAASGSLTKIIVAGTDRSSQIGTNITYNETNKSLRIQAAQATNWQLASGKTVVATIGGKDYTITTSGN